MSNLSAHRPADYRLESFLPKDLGWEEEALFKSGFKGREYGETDWSDIPARIDAACNTMPATRQLRWIRSRVRNLRNSSGAETM